jgi:phosphoribosylglycinamide formyltransferase-1
VHLVDEEYDRGPIVMQNVVEVSDEDTAETLAAKVLSLEHRTYPQAIQLFVEGRVEIVGKRAHIRKQTVIP